MTDTDQDDNYLTGQFLVATPTMPDERFHGAVVYVCAHNADGAMGLIVNQSMEKLSFADVLDQLEIKGVNGDDAIRVQFGGPVEPGHGFVLHSTDFLLESSLSVDDTIALSATVDMLKLLAEGQGPKKALFALGYAGWGAGQLDQELLDNGWLVVDGDQDILFSDDLAHKWDMALAKIGVDAGFLSEHAGHA